jgi:hypothetical protein
MKPLPWRSGLCLPNGRTVPRQNRVTPSGKFEATSARGLFMGNRGILHDDHGTLGSARWRHKNWIVCALAFKDRHQAIWRSKIHSYTFEIRQCGTRELQCARLHLL